MMSLFAVMVPMEIAAPLGAVGCMLHLIGWVWEKLQKPKGE